MKLQILVVMGAMVLSTKALAKEDFKEKHPRRAEVNERIRNQEKRIREGLASGKLTPAQAKELRGEEAGMKAEEQAEVKANGGYLTKGEQKQLNQELNQDSRQIKHDEFKDEHPRRAEVNGRINSEDRRIEQGEKSGELTATQAKQLDGEVAGVKAQEKAEVAANGGYLTKGEQKQLNQELNQDSAQIHAEKQGN